MVGGLRSGLGRCALRAVMAALLAALVVAGSAGAAGLHAGTVCRGSCVDLSVTVSDGVSSAVPGGATVYLVTVRNAGPSSLSSLTLTDVASAAFQNELLAPISGSYNKSSHLWSGLSLGSGRSVTMLVAGTLDPTATGTVANTVTVAPGAGTTETNQTDNAATDTDTLAPLADLSVGLTDGVASLVAGRSAAYTVTVRNNGLSTVGSVVLTDAVPAALTGVAFAPGSGSYSPATHVWTGLSLAAGHSVTMTVSGTVAPSATGTLLNNVTVAPPSGTTDPISANNSASDTDAVSLQADLSVSDSDGATTAAPGFSTTYTVVVSNLGPSNATGATVTDTLPPAVGSDSWTGSNGTSGNGSLHTTVTVPAGGSVTYTIVAAIGQTARGSLANVATVAAPAGLSDGNTANNSATDTDTLVPTTDLSITNTDGVTALVPGTTTTYTIVVSNSGPLTATGAVIHASAPAGVSSDTWTGPSGTSGSGAIDTTITLTGGTSATYTVHATVDPAATAPLAAIATVTAPAGLTDGNPANNSATDTDILTPTADLEIVNSDGATSAAPGGTLTYTVTVSNAGPSTVAGATVADPTPTGIDSFSWTGPNGTSGTGALSTTVSLAPGATATYTVTAGVDPAATGTIVDTASITAPAGVTDSNLANNSAADTDTLSNGGVIVSGRFKLGNLVLCNLAGVTDYLGNPLSLGDLDGLTVRQFLALAETRLGGGTGPDSYAGIWVLASRIDSSFLGGTPPDTFTDDHLSTSTSCQRIDWQPGQVLTYEQASPSQDPLARGLVEFDFGIYAVAFPATFGGLTVGDTTDTNGFTLTFENPDDVFTYLPGEGVPGALTRSEDDPARLDSSGLLGPEVVMLRLNVDFSDSYVPRTCSPAGAASSDPIIAGIPCPWGLDDLLTFGQVGWTSEGAPLSDTTFDTVEHNALVVGDPSGNHIELTSADAVKAYFPSGGPAGSLTTSFLNPTQNATGTGVFGGDVVALKLDVDYSDAGLIPNASGLDFGDLTLCGVPSLPALTGMRVRDYLALANAALAGHSTTYSPSQLQSFTDSLGVAFPDGLVGPAASYLFNGACPAGAAETP